MRKNLFLVAIFLVALFALFAIPVGAQDVIESHDGLWEVDLNSGTAQWVGPTDGTAWVQTMGLFEDPIEVAGTEYPSLLELMKEGIVDTINFEIDQVGMLEICVNEEAELDGMPLIDVVDANRSAWGLGENDNCTDMISVPIGEHSLTGNAGFDNAGFTVRSEVVGFAVDAVEIPRLTTCWTMDFVGHTATWTCVGDNEILPTPAMTTMSRTWDSSNNTFGVNQYNFTTTVVTYTYMCNGSLTGPTTFVATECGLYELAPGSYVYSFADGRNRTSSGLSVTTERPADFVPAPVDTTASG